jgi:catechol 2,3-dioxygenase-like lactoylglutathione lyase family enzyme
MLGSSRIMAFVPTNEPAKARAFYEGTLGLRFVSEDHFALVFDAEGIMLRVTTVPDFKPTKFTILGWEVPDVENAVATMRQRGVTFENYGLPDQNERGIWAAPSGAKVAWFKDPDGNILSVTQFT